MAEEAEENGKQNGPEEREGEVGELERSARSDPRTSIFSEARGNMGNWIETRRTQYGTSDSTNPSWPLSLHTHLKSTEVYRFAR
jgi:hypothetical protein